MQVIQLHKFTETIAVKAYISFMSGEIEALMVKNLLINIKAIILYTAEKHQLKNA